MLLINTFQGLFSLAIFSEWLFYAAVTASIFIFRSRVIGVCEGAAVLGRAGGAEAMGDAAPQVHGEPLDQRRRLEPATGNERSFRHTARELLALSAWRTGDTAQARRWTDLITNDLESPAGAKGIAEILTTLMPAEAKS